MSSFVEVKLNLDDFYAAFDGDGLIKDMRECLLEDVMRRVRKDPRYKEQVELEFQKAIANLEESLK